MRQPIVNRSRQEIIRDILATIEDANLSRTKIMYRASLSYTQLKYYEEYLHHNSLISMTDDDLWTLTEKGEQYLAACKLADRILKTPPEVKKLMTAEFSASPSISK